MSDKIIKKIIKEIKLELNQINIPVIYYQNISKKDIENDNFLKTIQIKRISSYSNDVLQRLNKRVGIIRKILKKYELDYRFIFIINEHDIVEFVDEYENNPYFSDESSAVVCNKLNLFISELIFEPNTIELIIGLLSQKSERKNLKNITFD